MPMSVAVSLMMTMALVTSIMAWLILGEQLTLPELVAIIGGFFGCILITNSDAFITNEGAELLEMQ